MTRLPGFFVEDGRALATTPSTSAPAGTCSPVRVRIECSVTKRTDSPARAFPLDTLEVERTRNVRLGGGIGWGCTGLSVLPAWRTGLANSVAMAEERGAGAGSGLAGRYPSHKPHAKAPASTSTPAAGRHHRRGTGFAETSRSVLDSGSNMDSSGRKRSKVSLAATAVTLHDESQPLSDSKQIDVAASPNREPCRNFECTARYGPHLPNESCTVSAAYGPQALARVGHGT